MITKEQAEAWKSPNARHGVHMNSGKLNEFCETVIALHESVERLEDIGRRIIEGDERGQGIQWSEAMSELEAILKETTND